MTAAAVPAPTCILPDGVEVRRCPDGDLWLRREHVLDLRGDGRRWVCLSTQRSRVTDEAASGWTPVAVTFAA